MMKNKRLNLDWVAARNLFLTSLALAACSETFAQSLESEFRKEGVEVRAAYDELTEIFQESSAVIYGRIPMAYGVVMSSDGHVLVKSSELKEIENATVIVGKKRYREFEILAESPEWDVTMIQVDAEELKPIEFSDSEPAHGTIVLSNSGTTRFKRRAQLGLIAANARAVGKGPLAVLGIQMDSSEEGVLKISGVSPESGAKDAGLEEGDVILSMAGVEVSSADEVPPLVKEKSPGDMIQVKIRREIEQEPEDVGEVDDPFAFAAELEEVAPVFEEKEVAVELRERQKVFPEQLSRNDMMSGEFSSRRSNFPRVLQHDTSLGRRTPGGPLLTLDGKCVGMNIAFASRECSYAIPAKDLQELYQKLRGEAGLPFSLVEPEPSVDADEEG